MEYHSTEISVKEQRALEFLVENLGGHFVTVVRKGEGRLAGFSISNRKTFAIMDLLLAINGEL